MDCPYNIPLKAKYGKLSDSWLVENAKGIVLFFDLSEERAKYLVQAINSHEKLVIVVRHLVESATRYPEDYATKDLNKLIPYLIKEAKQALKEAEKP